MGVITYITTPDRETYVKVVSPEDFSRCEFNNTEIHYCTIIGDSIYISSKAKYNHVLVHYSPEPKQIKGW